MLGSGGCLSGVHEDTGFWMHCSSVGVFLPHARLLDSNRRPVRTRGGCHDRFTAGREGSSVASERVPGDFSARGTAP